ARGHGGDDDRMRESRRHEPFEFGNELMDALGRKVEPKPFDRDETILVRIVRAKHRSKRASANLMKNPKRTKGVWRRCTRSFRVQWQPPQEGTAILTLNR